MQCRKFLTAIVLLVLLSASASDGAQLPGPVTQTYERGVLLKAYASESVRRWCSKEARKVIRGREIGLSGIAAAVEKKFPEASAEERRAAEYLVVFLAYEQEMAAQRGLRQRAENSSRNILIAPPAMAGGAGSMLLAVTLGSLSSGLVRKAARKKLEDMQARTELLLAALDHAREQQPGLNPEIIRNLR